MVSFPLSFYLQWEKKGEGQFFTQRVYSYIEFCLAPQIGALSTIIIPLSLGNKLYGES
jgi:hypothetical protein